MSDIIVKKKYVHFVLVHYKEGNMRLINSQSSLTCCGIIPGYSLIDTVFQKESRIYKGRRICDSRLAQSLKQFFIDVSFHILVASLTLMALFKQCVISYTCS